MGETCGIRRAKRRLLVSTIVAFLASAFLVQPAFGQLNLGSTTNGAQPPLGATIGTVTQALPTGQVAQQVAPVVQQVAAQAAPVAQPVAQTTAPVARAAAPVVQQATPVVRQAAAPVTTAAVPVVRAAEPVLAAADPVVRAAAPVLQAAQPVLETTKPVLGATGPSLETTPPLLESAAPRAGTSTPESAPAAGADTAATGMAVPLASSTAQLDPALVTSVVLSGGGTGPGSMLADRQPRSAFGAAGSGREAFLGPVTPGGLIDASTDVTFSGSASAARAVVPRRPAPSMPEGPVGLLAAISAAFASSAGLLFLAVLAAAMLLAVPGLGRRLRPIVAPRPLPIALASLERPG